MRFVLLAATALLVSAAPASAQLQLAASLKAPRIETPERRDNGTRIFRAPSAVSDTLVASVTWTGPADDGRGLPDSVVVRFGGGIYDSAFTFRTKPFPTSAGYKVVIPTAAYTGAGGSATFDLIARAVVFRRGTPTFTNSNTVRLTLVDAAPPPLTGLVLTAIKRP